MQWQQYDCYRVKVSISHMVIRDIYFFNQGSGYEKSKVNYRLFRINMLFFTPIEIILMAHSILELPLMAFQLCHCIKQ